MPKSKKKTTVLFTRALIQPSTLNQETREVEVVFATETPVERWGWDENYNEILVCEESAVRMDRINSGLPVLNCHSFWSVFDQLGRTVDVWFDKEKREICARIRFSKRSQVEDLFQDIVDGIVTSISVGYRVFKYERIKTDSDKLPEYRAVDWEPYEISFAPVPADNNSGVRSRAEEIGQHEVEIITVQSNKRSIMPTIKKRSEENTVDFTVGDEAVKKGDEVTLDDGKVGIALSDGEPGETIQVQLKDDDDDEGRSGSDNDDDDNDDDDDDENNGSRSQSKTDGYKARLNAILKSTRAAGLPDSLAIDLANGKRTLAECRQAIIEKKAADNKPIDGTHGVRVGVDAIIKKRAGIQSAILYRIDPRLFKEERNAFNEYRGMSMIEMAKEVLQERGINFRGKSKAEIADMIFGRAHGSDDFPVIFENVISKLLRAEYQSYQEYWDKISRPTTVADFREKSLYQFGTVNGMKEIKEGGEIKYTTIQEGKESIRVKSYGEGIRYTRQAFINDDLSVLETIPTRFRKDWDLLRGDLVWGLLTQNVKMGDGKALFHADHKNLLTGATSVLSEEGLKAAQTLFRRQTGLDGKTPVRVEPRFLIVPPELEVAAKKLMADITATKTEDKNVFAGAFDPIVEPRLTDTKAWYLSADPYAIDSIYTANLEGEEDLRVNSEHSFKTDTMDFAIRGDFGTSVVDHRGLLKSNGQ